MDSMTLKYLNRPNQLFNPSLYGRSGWTLLFAIACLVTFVTSPPASAQAAEQEFWIRETVFTAPRMGHAVSGYATRVIAGADEAVHVFELGAEEWTRTATLTASDGVSGDEFGAAVYLSGNFAVIGAPGAEADGYVGAGAAYVFQVLSDGSWVQRARLVSGSPATGAHFGAAVSASAELYYAIGSPGSGMATVFEPDVPGSSWQIGAELTAPDLTSNEAIEADFGTTAEISIGFDLVAVGAPGADGSGAVYAYRRVDSSWLFDQKLVDSPRITAARFGQVLSLEASSILIGAPGAASATGVFFDPNSGVYTPLGYDLGGPDFGGSVGSGSGSGGGARGIAGDPAFRVAYFYGRSDSLGFLSGTLVPSAGAHDDGFGASVDVVGAGPGAAGMAVVGAPGADAIYIFDLGTSETFDHVSVTLGRGLSYDASADVYGRFNVTRDASTSRVVAVTGRGRLLTETVPPPFVAFELQQLRGSSRLTGSILIHEPETGFEHELTINSSAQAVSETAVSGYGNGFEVHEGPQPRVTVDWAVDALTPSGC